MNTILEVKNLTMNFGGLQALNCVDMDVYQNEILAAIGPNGAGKSTLFNCITGIYNPTSGDIFISNKFKEKINGLKPNQITQKGISRTFQNIRLFPNMTVLENVMIGRHCRTFSGIFGAVFRSKKTMKEEDETIEKSYEILKRFALEKWVNDFAKNLPYGAQKKLEIARAIATEPFLLLLDEPAAGMNLQETKELVELIKSIKEEENISIILIEHDMKLVMSLSDRIFVMDYGKKIAEGKPTDIKNDPIVIKAYLGEDF